MATKTGPVKRAKSLIEQLRRLVAALPTEAEKQEIKNNLDAVAKLFLDMRQLLDAVPTAADVLVLRANSPRAVIDPSGTLHGLGSPVPGGKPRAQAITRFATFRVWIGTRPARAGA